MLFRIFPCKKNQEMSNGCCVEAKEAQNSRNSIPSVMAENSEIRNNPYETKKIRKINALTPTNIALCVAARSASHTTPQTTKTPSFNPTNSIISCRRRFACRPYYFYSLFSIIQSTISHSGHKLGITSAPLVSLLLKDSATL